MKKKNKKKRTQLYLCDPYEIVEFWICKDTYYGMLRDVKCWHLILNNMIDTMIQNKFPVPTSTEIWYSHAYIYGHTQQKQTKSFSYLGYVRWILSHYWTHKVTPATNSIQLSSSIVNHYSWNGHNLITIRFNATFNFFLCGLDGHIVVLHKNT